MKLLLDENLSQRIIPFIEPVYQGSTHVALVGLERANDQEVWEFARKEGYILVSKDSDFYDLSLLYGAPPQVVWIRHGNTGKATVVRALLDSAEKIQQLLFQEGVACVEIY